MSLKSMKASVRGEIVELLDIPYEEHLTRSSIVYIARALTASGIADLVIVWEFTLQNHFTFEMRRNGERFWGRGETAREAFANKKKQFVLKVNR